MPMVARDIPPPARQNGHRPAAPEPPRRSRIPRVYGVVAFVGGLVFWPVGAMYTATGWAWLINFVVVNWLGMPALVPPPTGNTGLVAAGLVGLIYSAIELTPPSRRRFGLAAWLLVGVIWLVVIVSDVGTTFAATVRPPTPPALPLLRWLAETWTAAAAWAILLTFTPDQAIVRGWRIMWGRPPFGK